jgi:hypothetical protein
LKDDVCTKDGSMGRGGNGGKVLIGAIAGIGGIRAASATTRACTGSKVVGFKGLGSLGVLKSIGV